jgi:hypothetical protein
MSSFAEYATSTAFQIRLSKSQIRGLGYLYKRSRKLIESDPFALSDAITWELRRKGLIHPLHRTLTVEGELCLQLCAHAGLISLPEASERAEAA